MIDERWNGFRLELAAIDLGGTENRRSNHVPEDAQIQGVVFEPCGVLYDDSAWRRWLWQLVSRMGLCTRYTPFFRVWESEFQEAIWSGQLDLWTALARYLRSAGMPPGDIDEVIAASRAKYRRYEQETRPFPDARTILRQLQAGGMQLAVIAFDRNRALKIRERLDRVGIGKLVTRVYSQPSDPTQVTAWRYDSLAALPGSPASWAFVGRRQAGLDAARRLGLLSVAFNHDADAAADVYIEQFSQLNQLLDRSGKRDDGFAPAKAA